MQTNRVTSVLKGVTVVGSVLFLLILPASGFLFYKIFDRADYVRGVPILPFWACPGLEVLILLLGVPMIMAARRVRAVTAWATVLFLSFGISAVVNTVSCLLLALWPDAKGGY